MISRVSFASHGIQQVVGSSDMHGSLRDLTHVRAFALLNPSYRCDSIDARARQLEALIACVIVGGPRCMRELLLELETSHQGENRMDRSIDVRLSLSIAQCCVWRWLRKAICMSRDPVASCARSWGPRCILCDSCRSRSMCVGCEEPPGVASCTIVGEAICASSC